MNWLTIQKKGEQTDFKLSAIEKLKFYDLNGVYNLAIYTKNGIKEVIAKGTSKDLQVIKAKIKEDKSNVVVLFDDKASKLKVERKQTK